MTPIGYCLIGYGRIAQAHLAAVASLKESIRLVAIVSRNTAKAEAAAKDFGAKKVYSTIEEAVRDREVEAVDICLPHHLHESAAVLAARQGKHILIEKPLARNLEEADRIITAAKSGGVTLMVGQSRRFTNAVFESKKLVEEGRIGRVRNIVATMWGYMPEAPVAWWKSSRLAGGLLMSLWAPHIVDYILWIYGQPPSSVYAEMYNVRPDKWEGEDEVNLAFNFDNNAMANVYMSWNVVEGVAQDSSKMWSSKNGRYERVVVGERGRMILEDDTELSVNGEQVVSGPQEPSSFYLELREFVAAISEGREPLTSGRDNRKVIQVIEACRVAAAKHCVVGVERKAIDGALIE